MRLVLTFIASLLMTPTAQAASLRYCVPVNKIDYNPFREIVDGKDLAYLTLLRSYISTDPSEPGLLSATEFSPDGKIFTGRLSQGLRWPDGKAVTPQEAANGITRALPLRPIGKRVKVLNAEMIDASTFMISFSSDVENLTGILREALSTNSRHNRFWPMKEGAKGPQVIGKFPQSGANTFKVGAHEVALVNESGCKSSEMSIFPEAIQEPLSGYSVDKSPSISALFILFNTNRLNLKERQAVFAIARKAFAKDNTALGIVPVDSFFSMGEPGHQASVNWAAVARSDAKLKRKIVLAYEHPFFKNLFKDYKEVELVNRTDFGQADGHLMASGLQDGRHVILQDFLKWAGVEALLRKAPETVAHLKDIAQRSASTIPPDNKVLANFEKVAMTEASFAPLGRKSPLAYTKKGSPVVLGFNSKGEITFKVNR